MVVSALFTYRNGVLFWTETGCFRMRGKPAGTKHRSGYVQIYYKAKSYQRGRLVWEIHNGPVPDGYTVDHINAVRDDDRIENLQLLTQRDNVYKGGLQTGRSHNKSGFNGVCWHGKAAKWMAYITLFGKRKYIGLFDTASKAAAAREKFEEGIDGRLK